MKFLSVAAVAFSLASQVIAAPTSVMQSLPVVGDAVNLVDEVGAADSKLTTITPRVSIPVGDIVTPVTDLTNPVTSPLVKPVEDTLGSVVKKDTVSDIVTPVTDAVAPVTSPLEDTLSSVVKKSTSPVATLIAAINTLVQTVEAELNTISMALPFPIFNLNMCLTVNPASAVAKDVTTSVVPVVLTALTNIANALKTVLADITPVVNGVVVPLVEGEAEGLLNALQDLSNLISNIASTLVYVLKTVTAGKFLRPPSI
jgi:phage-related protein